jgi:hypothetical protein
MNNYEMKTTYTNIKEYKFKIADGDFDSRISEREISGKITRARRKAIEHSVRKFNRTWEAPYGYSHNGYAYRCGCEHDCCGCLVHKGMAVEFRKLGKNHIAVLSIHENYNY